MFEDPTRPGKQQQLGQELKELMSMEQALDQLIQSCSLNFKHLTEDKANKRYPVWWWGGGGSGSRALLHAQIYPEFVWYLPAQANSPSGSGRSVSSFLLGFFSQVYQSYSHHKSKSISLHLKNGGKRETVAT